MLCSGIDLHKRTVAIHALDEAGRSFARPTCRPTAA